MNTLECYRWPDFFFNEIGIGLLTVVAIVTVFSLITFMRGTTSGFTSVILAIVLLGLISLSFTPRVYIGKDGFYLKNTESFIAVKPGYYTLSGYLQNQDLLYIRISKKIYLNGKYLTIQYFVPITLHTQNIRAYRIFESNCKECCTTVADVQSVAHYHQIEGLTVR